VRAPQRTGRIFKLAARHPTGFRSKVCAADVDVVLIISSPDSHAPLVKTALEHGKHVVVEKPARNRCEAQQLLSFRKAWIAFDVRAVRPARSNLSRTLGGFMKAELAKCTLLWPLRQCRFYMGSVVPQRKRWPIG
jgi:hypothetical protein